MLGTTVEVIRAGLKSDPSVTPTQRGELLRLLREGPKPQPQPEPAKPARQPRIASRKEVAERLSVSLRLVDRLAKAGTLKRVRLPGRTRAIGFRAEDLDALIQGQNQVAA